MEWEKWEVRNTKGLIWWHLFNPMIPFLWRTLQISNSDSPRGWFLWVILENTLLRSSDCNYLMWWGFYLASCLPLQSSGYGRSTPHRLLLVMLCHLSRNLSWDSPFQASWNLASSLRHWPHLVYKKLMPLLLPSDGFSQPSSLFAFLLHRLFQS